ncbi:MAG TPA: stage III sporulation protein AB [Tissierellia bacterium]|nr:stage III sporulation protein AB [Tissierellia bacterium]
MIILKIIGCTLIVLSSSLIGYIYGKSYKERLENLIYLENCIKILETEIMYGANPLPEALKNVYKKGNKKVSFIFDRISQALKEHKSGEVLECFLMVSDTMKKNLNFKKEDVEVFTNLGRTIGSSNRKDQEKSFKLILAQIKALQKEARLEKEKNEKMFKNLGFLSGLAIVIILL